MFSGGLGWCLTGWVYQTQNHPKPLLLSHLWLLRILLALSVLAETLWAVMGVAVLWTAWLKGSGLRVFLLVPSHLAVLYLCDSPIMPKASPPSRSLITENWPGNWSLKICMIIFIKFLCTANTKSKYQNICPTIVFKQRKGFCAPSIALKYSVLFQIPRDTFWISTLRGLSKLKKLT